MIRKETKTRTSEHCNRLVVEGSNLPFCPKHLVMSAGAEGDEQRKMEKLRAAKARKAALREALKTSPLRAYNPSFDERNRTGYES